MSIKLNHTIILSRDKRESSTFLAELFGLPAPTPFGPFLGVHLHNEVTLDYVDAKGEIASMHYAFLISEEEFDAIFGRIKQRKLDYWADPGQHQAGQINTRDGGRGVYFEDPSGHLLEILTRPYGSGDA
jgi:catechol 2,3-dioxygenase-like lactoylglutathione lyase family enzyme